MLEEADGSLTHLGELWFDNNVRMNEGGCDPDGRFYCGSMAYDQRPGGGALYRLDPDGSVQVVLENVTISNGLEWSPDGSRAYYNDTPTQRIDVFDYDVESGLTGLLWAWPVCRCGSSQGEQPGLLRVHQPSFSVVLGDRQRSRAISCSRRDAAAPRSRR